jgi:hypothetical protein
MNTTRCNARLAISVNFSLLAIAKKTARKTAKNSKTAKNLKTNSKTAKKTAEKLTRPARKTFARKLNVRIAKSEKTS